MSRFIIKNRLERREQLVDFNLEGYAFDEAASAGNELVFKRRSSEKSVPSPN